MGRGKKRKNFYSDFKKAKRWRGVLEVGMKGFMCACNLRVKECIREAYNLLNEYADKLEPKVEDLKEKPDEESLEDELENELKDLRQKPDERKFQAVETGGDSTVFIKTTLDDPVKLARDIFVDIYNSKQNKSRFLLRLIPVQVTCKAYIEDIRKTADMMFDEPFKCEPLSFNVYYKARNNNSVVRTEVLTAIVLLVRDRNIDHKVDLSKPDKTVIVEITKNVCCLSVVSEFYKFRKYNLSEAAKGDIVRTVDGSREEQLEAIDLSDLPSDVSKNKEGDTASVAEESESKNESSVKCDATSECIGSEKFEKNNTPTISASDGSTVELVS